MNILKEQTAEILEQGSGISGIEKQIEQAARTCYQSQDKIADGTATSMVKWLAEHEHTAMLEHGTVYLKMQYGKDRNESDRIAKYSTNPYSAVDEDENGVFYITTNYRVIIENGWKSDLKFLCEPTKYHEKRYTLRFITNLQVATELLRHRKMSFAMESSRYCCYDKEKFGDELTFILPEWINDSTPKRMVVEWANGCQDAENHYMRLRQMGWPAEQCAQFLPKAAKTQIVMTGFASDWKHFLDLRYYEKTGKVHPQMKALSTKVKALFENEGIDVYVETGKEN